MTTHPTTEDAERLIAAAPCPSGWRPIETAPKDGTWVLLCKQMGQHYEIGNGRWGQETCPLLGLMVGWSTYCLMTQPTHWQPLPAAPIPDGGPA